MTYLDGNVAYFQLRFPQNSIDPFILCVVDADQYIEPNPLNYIASVSAFHESEVLQSTFAQISLVLEDSTWTPEHGSLGLEDPTPPLHAEVLFIMHYQPLPLF